MKTTHLLTVPSVCAETFYTESCAEGPSGNSNPETVRHILVGSPGAVRQTIHLLHVLKYAETVLWSPAIATTEPIVITPLQGETMSLLQKQI